MFQKCWHETKWMIQSCVMNEKFYICYHRLLNINTVKDSYFLWSLMWRNKMKFMRCKSRLLIYITQYILLQNILLISIKWSCIKRVRSRLEMRNSQLIKCYSWNVTIFLLISRTTSQHSERKNEDHKFEAMNLHLWTAHSMKQICFVYDYRYRHVCAHYAYANVYIHI